MKTLSLAAALCATAAGAATVPTTTALVQSGPPGNYSLTATVSNPGSAAASGTVTFIDVDNANSVLGTAGLVPSVTLLGPPVAQAVPIASASALAAGDFNGDGVLDLAVGSASAVSILLGNGDGTFTAKTTLAVSASPAFIVTGRFRAQGGLDLAVASGAAIEVFLGNGDGTFVSGAAITLGGTVTGLALSGADLLATSSGGISVLRGNGDGTFQPAVTTALSGSPGPVVATSFGAAVIDGAAGTVTPLLNAGGGSFTVKTALVSGGGPAGIATGDFDGDGLADLAVTNSTDGTVTIFSGDGSGAFSPGRTVAAGASPAGIVSADFNNDGIADLAVANGAAGTITLLLGKGLGGFTASTVTAAATALVAGDFDRSGNVDLAAGGAAGVTALLTQVQRTAIATGTSIAPSGLGVHQVIASYAGDASHDPSVSASTGLTTAPTVTFAPSQATLAVDKLGDTVSETVQINSAGNYAGDVNLTCAVTLEGDTPAAVPPSCTVDLVLTVSPATPATATLTVTTSVASTSSLQATPRSAAMAALFLLGLSLKRRRKLALFCLLFAAWGSSACGNSSNIVATLATTPGSYRVDVVGHGAAATFTATTSVVVTVPAQ